MRRYRCSTFLVLFAAAGLASPSGHAQSPQVEPTREECLGAVERARSLATALAPDDLSRRFAERHLQQAMVEAGNGEFDECLEYAERATEEVREHRHILQPGETIKILRADE